jgi:hypothetical protein
MAIEHQGDTNVAASLDALRQLLAELAQEQ